MICCWTYTCTFHSTTGTPNPKHRSLLPAITGNPPPETKRRGYYSRACQHNEITARQNPNKLLPPTHVCSSPKSISNLEACNRIGYIWAESDRQTVLTLRNRRTFLGSWYIYVGRPHLFKHGLWSLWFLGSGSVQVAMGPNSQQAATSKNHPTQRESAGEHTMISHSPYDTLCGEHVHTF